MTSVLDTFLQNDVTNRGNFVDWLFLVETLVIMIATLFYLFYCNRLAALFISFLLRLAMWKSNNAYFEIGSIQFAPLRGRILFNELRYISRNQSLRILSGHITWRYWLWHVRSEEDSPSEAHLPCRITVSMKGAEWFLYNRTPSYDAILAQLGLVDPLAPTASSPPPESESEKQKESEIIIDEEAERVVVKKIGKTKTDWLREALPIDIRCKTGSIIMGNRSTPTILISGFDSVAGSYAAVKARSRFDHYKQIYRFTFVNPKVILRTNPDYEGPMTQHGVEVLEKLKQNSTFDLPTFLARPGLYASLLVFRSLLNKLPRFSRKKREKVAAMSTPVDPPRSSSWQGLPRYRSSLDDPSATASTSPLLESDYAKVTTLLVSPELQITYYCDTAGRVPVVPKVVTGFKGLETFDIGNGDLSPEWGVDVVVKGGNLTYGPWADRQRSELQKVFTPSTFTNSIETPKLRPGDERMHTALKIFVEFSEGTTLRIPTREPSKDWKYDGVDSQGDEATIRPFGWLDISLGSNSTMSYVMPMIATSQGFDTLFELHLDELSISSSVNYATFLKAETCRIHCGLPAPLIWDEIRTWTVNTTISKPDIYLLRDHITLFTDVSKDWISGPPGAYDQFVPYMYRFNLNISEYTLRLYVNDHNVINNPSTIGDNTLLIARGHRLAANVDIPSDGYKMDCSVIKFQVDMPDLVLSMTLPEWNTHNAFLTPRTKSFATSSHLVIDGSYRFYSSVHVDHIERLKLNVDCDGVVVKTLGWMVRHLLNLRDNYFGTFTHFVTLEEYRHRHERNLQGDPLELKYRPGTADVFEVVVSLNLRNGLQIMPQELFDCTTAIVFVIPDLQVELRNHDYFMEMAVNIGPFRVIETTDCDALISRDFASAMAESDSVRVQGIEINANRLFGPQPRTATYLCIWSFHIGSIVGFVPPSFLTALVRMSSCLAINFSDRDNSLPADFDVLLDPDATLLTFDLDSLDIAVRGQETSIQFALLEGIAVRYEDLAHPPFLKTVAIEMKTIEVHLLAPLSGGAPWMEVASIETDISIVVGLSESGWRETAEQQLKFIQAQDYSTRRCPFIYGEGAGVSSHVGGLYLPAVEERVTEDFNYTEIQRRNHFNHRSESDYDSDDDDTRSQSIFSDYEQSTAHTSERFSAYVAVLQLSERSSEATLLDQPTFRQLPAVDEQESDWTEYTPLRLKPTLVRLRSFGETEDTDSARTVVDVRSRTPLRIVLTPIAVQVVSDIMASLPTDAGLERQLDDLFLSYVGSRGSISPVRFDQLEISAALPLVQIRTIQDVLRPDETVSLKVPRLSEQTSTFLCTLRLSIHDVSLSTYQITDCYGSDDPPGYPTPPVAIERRLAASAQSTRLEVFQPSLAALRIIAGPEATPHLLPPAPGRHSLTALDLQIAPCKLDLDLSTEILVIALEGGDTQLDFVDEAAELIIGSIWSWRSVSEALRSIKDDKSKARRLVWSIANVCQTAAIASFPTFLNRVSYLVGSTSNLRSDDGWKVLHNLRHCLRLGEEQVETFMRDLTEWPAESTLLEEVRDVLGRWRSWEIDSDDFRNSDFLPFVFESKLRAVERSLPTSPIAYTLDTPVKVEWRAGRFEARFCDGSGENRLSLGPLEAYATSSGRQPYSPMEIHVRVTLDLIEGNVDREILGLIRHIIRVRRTFEHKIRVFRAAALIALSSTSSSTTTATLSSMLSTLPAIQLGGSIGVRRIRTKGRADSLQATGSIDDTSFTVSASLARPAHQSHHRQLTSNIIFAIGSASLATWERNPNREELLLSMGAEGLSISGCFEKLLGPMEQASLYVIVAVMGLKASIPKDALRAYEFIEDWSSENYSTYHTLLTEMRDGIDDVAREGEGLIVPSSSFSSIEFLARTSVAVQLSIPMIALELQAMRQLKMSYHVRDVSVHARIIEGSGNESKIGAVDVGVSIGSQSVRFLDDSVDNSSSTVDPITSFDLPVFRSKAHLDGVPCRQITILSTIDPITLSVDVTMIDHIVNVQARFGNDLDELLRVIRTKRANFVAATTSAVPETSERLDWDARIALRGFKIGVEGPQATQWIEAELLEGFVKSSLNNSFGWDVSVQNLTLSLAQRLHHSQTSTIDQRNRLAFFRLDFSASNATIHLPDLPALPENDTTTSHLHLRFPRIHAVLQPSAIEALGDLVDHFEREIDLRRTLRKEEIDAIRERVVQTLDRGEKPAGPQARSWIASCVVSFEAKDVGIAIPLSLEEGIISSDVKGKRGKNDISQAAFLTTLPSITFATQKGSACFARMDRLALQFVPHFDQSRKDDFNSDTHASHNRILFPQTQFTLNLSSEGPILSNAVVTGIEIDLESSVVAYSFSLVDIYRLSHERFAKFAPQTDRFETSLHWPASSESAPPPSSAVNSTFEFQSGTVRVHSKSSAWDRPQDIAPLSARPKGHRKGKSITGRSHFSKASISKLAELREESKADVFLLPAISVRSFFVEGSGGQGCQLRVDAVVHASNNTLYPTLLPFIASVSQQLARRTASFPPSAHLSSYSTPTLSLADASPSSIFGNLDLAVSLKIDQSRLDISCLPAAEVTARLTWESGGFLLTTTPQARGIEFAARVDGVAIGLKHSYAPEDCLSVEAKGMALSVSFEPAASAIEGGLLSLVVDLPDLSANMNFRHLQDWLCLKAVWIDRMDLGPVASTSAPDIDEVRIESTLSPKLTTLVLIRLQQLRFACDLGQAIGRSVFTAESVVVRLRRISDESRSLSFTVKSIVVVAAGRTAGTASIEGIMFETRLRDDKKNLIGAASDLLSIKIEIGKLAASLEYEYHRILLVESDPIAIFVRDDWSRLSSSSPELELGFTVQMGSLSLLATVATVPTLVRVSHRLHALIAEKSLQADTTILTAGLPPRATVGSGANRAVSVIASKLSGGGEGKDETTTTRILNRLDIKADRLRIAIFPDHFNEGEVFRMDAGDGINARLVRGVQEKESIHRDLHLFLGSFSIRKVDHRKISTEEEKSFRIAEWYGLFKESTERNIFTVPTTTITMESDQKDGSNRLVHSFAFTTDGNFDLALNYALLRNLGQLATAYSAAMDTATSSKPFLPIVTTSSTTSPILTRSSSSTLLPLIGSSSTDVSRDIISLPIDEESDSIIKMKLLPLSQLATNESRVLEFEARSLSIHQPKLMLLGEATPPISWLGAQNLKFPAWVHSGVTVPLEELLVGLSATYQGQLARQTLAKRPINRT